jgi:SRSO17 transposase
MERWSEASEAAFLAYVDSLIAVVGHADRAAPLKDSCLGLLMPGERKSVEPMAAVTAPARTSAQHQSLLHFVGQAAWSDEALLRKVRDHVLPMIERQGPISAWIIDDTGFPKKGRHSVGVARQYCGQLGKQDNCQVAVSLSVGNATGTVPIAWRLYLPESWAKDEDRRKTAKVPQDIVFKTKPQIALDQIKAAQEEGVTPGVILTDAGYGADGAFRAGVTALQLHYVVGVQPTLSVWRPGDGPIPPQPRQKGSRGFQGRLLRRDPDNPPICAKALALELPSKAWREVCWREGTNNALSSRFAALRLRPASRDWKRIEPHPEEWLLIEWPKAEPEPTKYWLSTLSAETAIETLVDTAKMRWRIERDYQDLKQELGLGHYEGRGWRGFHHHASLCIAAYGFMVSLRETFPPSAAPKTFAGKAIGLPPGYRPRGAPDPARTSRPSLNHNHSTTTDIRSWENPPEMSLLRQTDAGSTT